MSCIRLPNDTKEYLVLPRSVDRWSRGMLCGISNQTRTRTIKREFQSSSSGEFYMFQAKSGWMREFSEPNGIHQATKLQLSSYSTYDVGLTISFPSMGIRGVL